jgi:hypothetical protein
MVWDDGSFLVFLFFFPPSFSGLLGVILRIDCVWGSKKRRLGMWRACAAVFDVEIRRVASGGGVSQWVLFENDSGVGFD